MRYFVNSIKGLGNFEQISAARALVRIRLQLPTGLKTQAEILSRAKTTAGLIDLHAMLVEGGEGWEIDRMWWTFVGSSDNSSSNG
jgi:hypothetical protein